MLGKRGFKLLISISLIVLMFQPYLSRSVADSTYSEIWRQSDGSELENTISSIITSLVVENKYTYRINLEGF